MFSSLIPLAIAALLPVTLAAPASQTALKLPTCDPSYNYTTYNEVLRNSTSNEAGTISNQAQMTSASTYIIGYDGFGNLIPGIVQPMTDSLNKLWSPDLSAAKIKCPACAGKGGKTRYANPEKFQVLPYEDLYAIFSVTTNMLAAIDQKQCSVDGYSPPQSVRSAMRPFLDSIWKAMGTGPTAGKKAGLSGTPSGAILPYYNCLATYGAPADLKQWEDPWFALNEMLVHVNQTACVDH